MTDYIVRDPGRDKAMWFVGTKRGPDEDACPLWSSVRQRAARYDTESDAYRAAAEWCVCPPAVERYEQDDKGMVANG
ncbi:MAG: hypothetical protein ACKV2Q_36605 [Planctomycetaceae bacterium]